MSNIAHSQMESTDAPIYEGYFLSNVLSGPKKWERSILFIINHVLLTITRKLS